MISARMFFGQFSASPRARFRAAAAGALLATAALCGCSFSERLPGLAELEHSDAVQRSMSATAEVDSGGELKENVRIDVGDPVFMKDP